ncbi:MAG: right-handed parallel beta-helix repeat-containing protein [Planctomycetota bacterium]|nr:right-handed parallel beta-helix repeat-containing protein [Planctomycetota bacterium]
MLFLAALASLLALLSLSALAAPSPALSPFFVDPRGSDENSGTKEKPFATLERARAAVRALPAGQPREVVLRAGTYRAASTFALGPEDSGTPERPALWRAAEGEEVRLAGSVALPIKAFKPVADPAVLARLDPAARGNVLQIDVHALGVALPPALPAKFRGAPHAPELFCDDQRMTLARWPNEGWTTIAKIIDHGSDPRNGDHSGKPGVFEYSGDRPSRWSVEAGVWLRGYWCYDWSEEAIRVKAIDTQAKTITFAEPHVYGLKQGNPSPRRYYALNLLEELDSPGEFYLDRVSGLLYFWPPAAALRSADARIELSTLATPIVALKDAHDIVLRGLTIEAGLADGIEIHDGRGCRVEACTLRNLRQLGVNVNGGAGHRVVACDIHHTGTGGIAMVAGDRKTLTPAGLEALNNHIWRFSEHQLTYACAIRVGGVGNRAAHNLIHDAPHIAVAFAGNDHVFEFNVVHDVCTETDDASAFYTGRDPSARGHILRHNFWHHIGSPMGHGTAAVYFDDGDGGNTVLGNVFFHCGEPGRGSFGTVFSNGGHDLVADNNLFVSCRRALGSAPWSDKMWKETIDGGHDQGYVKKLREDVDITSEVYTKRYPALVGFLDPKPGQPRVSRAKHNLFVLCGQWTSGNWQCPPQVNWSADHDPGFADPAHGDFSLPAEAIKKYPGFEPIPFAKMGLYADELRPTPVREKWNYPAMEQAKAPGAGAK